jgi:hypothetical protein
MSLRVAAKTLAWHIKNSSILSRGSLVSLAKLKAPPVANLPTTPFWRIIDLTIQGQNHPITLSYRLTTTIACWVKAQERSGRHFADIGQEIIEVLRQHGVNIPRIEEFELGSNEAQHILPSSGTVTACHKKPS